MKLDRSIIGSDLVIIAAIVFDTCEGIIVISTDAANGSIPIHVLLSIFQYNLLTGFVIILASVLAAIGQWANIPVNSRIKFFLPQQTILVIAALAALMAIYKGHYSDGTERDWSFIICDQFPRIIYCIIYTSAIMARAKVK